MCNPRAKRIVKELKDLLLKIFSKGFATTDEKSKIKELYKALSDEEKDEVKEEVEKVDPLPEEEDEGGSGDGNGNDDDEDDDEKIADLSQNIAKQISESLSKIREKDAEKKKAITPEIKAGDPEIKLFETRKGKEIKLRKSEVEILGKWFQAFLRKDTASMFSFHQKLEPLVEGTNADGGYLVPTQLHNVIIDLLEDEAVIKPRATVIDMTGMKTNQLNIDGIATKPIVSWTGENTDKSTSSMTFNQISLTPYTLAAIVPLSTQLRDDTPFNVVQIVSKALSEAVAKAEDKAFVTGNGTGQPTGIDNYTLTTISAGNALTFDHLNSAFWKLPQAYRKNAVWIMNGRTISDISNIKDSNNRPLLLEAGILTEPGIPALKGRPVLEQNDLASSKIFFGDLKAYWIGQKMPLRIDIADQATIAGVNLWERNLIAVRVEERIDGELTTSRAFVEISDTGVS